MCDETEYHGYYVQHKEDSHGYHDFLESAHNSKFGFE